MTSSTNSSSDFPVLFTVDGSNSRHEIILVNPSLELSELKGAIGAVTESPNCAEVLSKYRSKDNRDVVAEIKVKWADRPLFPKQTLLTEQNVEAVLRMLAASVGKDVLDVKIVQKKVEVEKSES